MYFFFFFFIFFFFKNEGFPKYARKIWWSLVRDGEKPSRYIFAKRAYVFVSMCRIYRWICAEWKCRLAHAPHCVGVNDTFHNFRSLSLYLSMLLHFLWLFFLLFAWSITYLLHETCVQLQISTKQKFFWDYVSCNRRPFLNFKFYSAVVGGSWQTLNQLKTL